MYDICKLQRRETKLYLWIHMQKVVILRMERKIGVAERERESLITKQAISVRNKGYDCRYYRH